jgi:hypothetical protein
MQRRILMVALAGLFGTFLMANNVEAGCFKKKCKAPCETPCATPCETPCEPKCKKPKKHCFKKKKVCCEVVYAAPCSPCGTTMTYPSGQATPQAPSKSM